VHAIEGHIVDSCERGTGTDEVEYFDSSCIQFRSDVLASKLSRALCV